MDAAGYRQHPCKGDYFALAPAAPFRFTGLVYPVHGAAGLGVHVTLDLGGRVRFGPDAHYVEALDYAIDAAKAAAFAEAAGRYLPGLRAEWLTPDQAGIRPKLAGAGRARPRLRDRRRERARPPGPREPDRASNRPGSPRRSRSPSAWRGCWRHSLSWLLASLP